MRGWAVLTVALVSVAGAQAGLGKECWSNFDCPEGASCVAGDSVNSVQRCVAGTACSGAAMGNCPGDESSGQLACIWRPNNEACMKAPAGCKQIDGQYGIYKCISMARCDAYFEGSCSNSCNVNGKQCNGRGNCQLVGESTTKPSFACTCDNGWNGTRCNNVLDDSCMNDVGQCGEHGTCKDEKCVCSGGYTGRQCEKPPSTLSSSHSGAGVVHNAIATTPTAASTVSGSKTSGTNSKEKGHGNTALATIIAVIAAIVIVATIVFVVYARKRRQEEAAATGFQRQSSLEGMPLGPPTPKQRIVTM